MPGLDVAEPRPVLAQDGALCRFLLHAAARKAHAVAGGEQERRRLLPLLRADDVDQRLFGGLLPPHFALAVAPARRDARLGRCAIRQRVDQRIRAHLRRQVEGVARAEEHRLLGVGHGCRRLVLDERFDIAAVFLRRVKMQPAHRVLHVQQLPKVEWHPLRVAHQQQVERHFVGQHAARRRTVARQPAFPILAGLVIQHLDHGVVVDLPAPVLDQQLQRGLHRRVFICQEHNTPPGLRRVFGIDAQRQTHKRRADLAPHRRQPACDRRLHFLAQRQGDQFLQPQRLDQILPGLAVDAVDDIFVCHFPSCKQAPGSSFANVFVGADLCVRPP